MEFAEHRRKPEDGPEDRILVSNKPPTPGEEPVSPRTTPSQLPVNTWVSGFPCDPTPENTTLPPPTMSSPSKLDPDTSSDENEDRSPWNGANYTIERMRKGMRVNSGLQENDVHPAFQTRSR